MYLKLRLLPSTEVSKEEKDNNNNNNKTRGVIIRSSSG
jgi:hypothetical protein